MKITCERCHIFLSLRKMGEFVLEYARDPDGNVVHRALWKADRYECPRCGHAVCADFGDEPFETDEDRIAEIFTRLAVRGISVWEVERSHSARAILTK